MSEQAQGVEQQGFYWDKRGKVTAKWLKEDLERYERSLASGNDAQAVKSRQRVADQLAAYIAKAETRVVQRRTLTQVAGFAERFDKLAGTDYAIQLATVAAAKLAKRQSVPWDVRGRVVPQWIRDAAKTVKARHAALARAERAKDPVQIQRAKEAVLRAERRFEAMAAHGVSQIETNAYHPKPATVKVVEHIAESVEDVKVTAALAAGSSFSQERYEALATKLKWAMNVLPDRKGFLREREDAQQQAFLGTVKAAEKWDVGHPLRSKFSSYAYGWMGRFMECRTDEEVAANKRRPGSKMKMTSMDVHEDEESSDIRHPAASDNTAVKAFTNVVLETLPELERTVIVRLIANSETVKAVAQSMGIAPNTLRRIRDRALEMIQR